MLHEMSFNDLNTRLATLKQYIVQCLSAEDWHGVRDCATDIEVTLAHLSNRKTGSVLRWKRLPPDVYNQLGAIYAEEEPSNTKPLC